MRGLILAHKTTRPTAKLIANYLDSKMYSKIRDCKRFNYIFRYGNSDHVFNQPDIEFNTSDSIKISANKHVMKKVLHDNNIKIPKIYTIDTITYKALPVVARPNRHSKGKDFHVCRTMDEALYYLGCNYTLQSFLESVDTEYRIFVFKDRIFETNIKIRDDRNAHPYIRNVDHGWKIVPVRRSLVPNGIQRASKDATRAIGLDFSAVDICFTNKGEIFVYEVNSAPGLIERKAEKLAERITEELQLL